MYKCKYCGKEFETKEQLGGHSGFCKLNPNKRSQDVITSISRKIGDILHNKWVEKNPELLFEFTCEKCGKKFTAKMTQSKYNSLFLNNKLPRFCSSKCSHSRILSNESKDKISKSLKEYNKPRITNKEFKKTHCKFCGELLENGRCISNHPACNHHSINWYKNLIPFGFRENVIGTKEIYTEYNRIVNLLNGEYKTLSPKKIFEKYHIKEFDNTFKTPEALLHLLKNVGIKTRGLSESEIIAWCDDENFKSKTKTKYVCGYFDTWFGTKVYLRSSYEFDYAKILNEKRIHYGVESIRVKYFNSKTNSIRVAIPDFVLETNEIVEVKSTYTLDIQEMKDKKKAYESLGYKFKLILEHKEVNIDDL